MNTTFTEIDLVERRELREETIDRVDTLNKVKSLLLIPSVEVATVQMVADFYEVPKKTIETLTLRNRDELDSDGMYLLTKSSTLNLQVEGLIKTKYYAEVKLSDSSCIRVNNRGALAYPKRAVLRVGMLLRDSEIAREVRNQLLNVLMASHDSVKTQAIDEEQSLLMEITKAMMNGDAVAASKATADMIAYKNRHIAAIEAENKQIEAENNVLQRNLMVRTPRKAIRELVTLYCKAVKADIQRTWQVIYNELNYNHGINVKSRKTKSGKPANTPLVSFLNTDEQLLVIAIIVAMFRIEEKEVPSLIQDLGVELPELESFSIKKQLTYEEYMDEQFLEEHNRFFTLQGVTSTAEMREYLKGAATPEWAEYVPMMFDERGKGCDGMTCDEVAQFLFGKKEQV